MDRLRSGHVSTVPFSLEERSSIFVVIDEPKTGGAVRAGRQDKVEKARGTLEDALNKVLRARSNSMC